MDEAWHSGVKCTWSLEKAVNSFKLPFLTRGCHCSRKKKSFLLFLHPKNNTQSARYKAPRISNHCKGSECRVVIMVLQSENKRIAEKFANKPIKIQSKIMWLVAPREIYFNWLQRQCWFHLFHFDWSKLAEICFSRETEETRRQLKLRNTPSQLRCALSIFLPDLFSANCDPCSKVTFHWCLPLPLS